MIIAGGNGQGNQLNQLYQPFGICIDDHDQTTYIADFQNHRIVEWRSHATNGPIVAGGNGNENQTNQLNYPTDVIIDPENNSFIIADTANSRVMQWSRQTSSHGEIIISGIYCWGLTMHKDGSLYVSDYQKNEVRRWKKGETNGTIVAGGNGQGNQLNQLHHPMSIFVDDDHALYVSDQDNHRVMKWVKDAKEGIVVAGGNGQGDHVTQLSSRQGVIVDQFGQIYVADLGNHRVMRWCVGTKEGTIVVGGKGAGEQAHLLSYPRGLSFDGEGNLYVANWGNHQIQKFQIDFD
jgi:sugar lactone lactonase YvrE